MREPVDFDLGSSDQGLHDEVVGLLDVIDPQVSTGKSLALLELRLKLQSITFKTCQTVWSSLIYLHYGAEDPKSSCLIHLKTSRQCQSTASSDISDM